MPGRGGSAIATNSPTMNTNSPFYQFSNLDMAPYQISPSRSPTEAIKNTIITRPVKSESQTASLPPAQNMSGPSFDYQSYQQNTGLVAGSVAHTHAINQSLLYGNGYMSSDALDFNFGSNIASQSPFDSPLSDVMDAVDASPVRQTVDPSRLSESETSQSMLAPSNMRVYNGFHTNQAAALAAQAAQSKVKVEAQVISQQRILQQQRQVAQAANPKPRVQPTEDSLVNDTISQVLNAYRRQDSSSLDMDAESPDAHRGQSKDLDDMDEDERLLNSEEGKKLTPKERRQLRNKVSARHFRKRRKEMIVDLEVVNQQLMRENEQLKMENKKVIADFQNLRKFVEHMIATPNFQGYMQDQVLGLSAPQSSLPSPQVAQPRQRQRSQQRQQSLQQFNMPIIPEQNQPLQMADVLTEDVFGDDSMNDFGNNLLSQNSADFDMFSLNENTSIFAVLDTPCPAIDISALSGKTSNFVGHQEEFAADEKVEMAPLDKGPAPHPMPAAAEKAETSAVVDEEFDNDPAFALYHDQPGAVDAVRSDEPVEFDTEGLSHVDIFGGIEAEKVLKRFELVDASEEEVGAALAMERVQRISSSIDSVTARLELMTMNL